MGISMNLISFSLYGDNPKYTRGLIANLDIKLENNLYKDWDVIVYHDNSVKDNVLNELESKRAILRNTDDFGIFPASWRFLAYDEPNVERFICRDADSRISKREEEAVLQWVASDKILHIMRDHPHHGAYHLGKPILGGMWGMKIYHNQEKLFKQSFKELILIHQGGKTNCRNRDQWFWTDMNFLRDIIYSKFGTDESSMIHAAQDYMNRTNWKNENWAIDFPSVISKEKYFVGEVFYFDNGIEKRDYQYRER